MTNLAQRGLLTGAASAFAEPRSSLRRD